MPTNFILRTTLFLLLTACTVSCGLGAGRKIASEEIVRQINTKINFIPSFAFWTKCSLSPAYDFSAEKVSIPKDTPANDLIGLAVEFGEDWGGWDSAAIQFQNGLIGHCKAISPYIKEGTRAKVDDKIYVYKSGRWYSSNNE